MSDGEVPLAAAYLPEALEFLSNATGAQFQVRDSHPASAYDLISVAVLMILTWWSTARR